MTQGQQRTMRKKTQQSRGERMEMVAGMEGWRGGAGSDVGDGGARTRQLSSDEFGPIGK